MVNVGRVTVDTKKSAIQWAPAATAINNTTTHTHTQGRVHCACVYLDFVALFQVPVRLAIEHGAFLHTFQRVLLVGHVSMVTKTFYLLAIF